MSYRVERVRTRLHLNDFLKLPVKIYRDDPHWVPPLFSEVRRVLNRRKNPYFANASVRLFVAYDDHEPVARAAVVINSFHEEKFGVKTAFFGFFESEDDRVGVQHLFSEVERYCRGERVALIEGPFNPNHYSELGLQISHFGMPPTFFQPYNPEYYLELLEKAGFHISKVVFTAKNDRIREFLQEHTGGASLTSNGGYVLRSFKMEDFHSELEKVREVFNDAFDENWHFLPVSREEYEFSTKFLRFVTTPELLKIVEYNAEPVGVLMCVPDINPLLRGLRGRIGPLKLIRFLRGRKNINHLVVYAVGLKKTHRCTRANKLLLEALCEMATGYDTLEATWMSPENTLALKSARRLGMVPDRQFAIYSKAIDGIG